MALSILKYLEQSGGQYVFEADIGANSFYQYKTGSSRTKQKGLDIVDNVLNKGVVLSGDLTIALAQVDLIYARLSVLLCAADRVLPNEDTDFIERHHARRRRRAAAARLRATRFGAAGRK